MKIQEILAKNKNQLITVRLEDKVETAAARMTNNNIGACPVRDMDGNLVGVLSERDIVRALAAQASKVTTMTVGELMSTDVATCNPDDSIQDANTLMSRRHVRHLPVVDNDGAVVGMISMRDVIRSSMEQTELERNVLRDVVRARA